ncbi:polysaccharide deacetylase family protein [Actinomadura barringtoniae]|nr:polysaccharide deacetylase family protein [Actinomadura barringtoniae]
MLEAGLVTLAGLTAACSSPHTDTKQAERTGPTSPSVPATSPSTDGPASTRKGRGGEVVHGPRSRREVALTFHGAGEVALAERLLTAIEQAKATVTVMAVGTWLDSSPHMASRVLHGGHELGNHTQHHLDIKAMSAAQAQAEISECARRLKSLTGTIGAWFRPSQTRHAPLNLQREAARIGYQACLSYDVDSLDFTDPGPRAVARNVLTKVQPGSIVSLHFGHAGTIQAMPVILDGLKARGLTPVTVSRLLRS